MSRSRKQFSIMKASLLPRWYDDDVQSRRSVGAADAEYRTATSSDVVVDMGAFSLPPLRRNSGSSSFSMSLRPRHKSFRSVAPP